MKELMGFKSVALQMFQHTVTAKKAQIIHIRICSPDSLTLRHVGAKFPVYLAPTKSGTFMPDSQINLACA